MRVCVGRAGALQRGWEEGKAEIGEDGACCCTKGALQGVKVLS